MLDSTEREHYNYHHIESVQGATMQAVRAVQPEGLIARLVTSYVTRRGISKTKLAARSGTDPKVIAGIMRGVYDNGTEALGLRFRPDGERIIFAVGRALEIPDVELDAAIIADLRASSSSSLEGRFLQKLNAISTDLDGLDNVVSIDSARRRRPFPMIVSSPAS